jgi:hypothetical protein
MISKVVVKRTNLFKKEKKHVEWVDGYSSSKKLEALGIQGEDSDEQNSDLQEPIENACDKIHPDDFHVQSEINSKWEVHRLVNS